MLKLDNFYKARYELSKVIRQTDVVQAPQVNPECDVYLKLECLQRTGSFKVRGACYKISQLSDEEKAHGVIACSAGNHAQGVALGATAHGIKSLICLPAGAPISKVEATKGYGADVCLVPGVYDDAYQKAIELRDEKGYTFVHPFDDPNVIAGQGTIGLELIDQVKDMDAVVVPVGGGGLISGVAFALKTLNPHIKVYGVQAAGAASMVQSLHVHKRECLSSVSTIADGICVKEPGELTYEICSKYVDDIVTVSATSVAAVMFNKVPVKGKKVVCIVSGGNIDVTILNRVVERGLAKSGRIAIINVELDDKPGKLVEVASVIAKAGANITNVYHDRNSDSEKVNSCILRVICETRNQEHVAAINNALRESGFKLV